MTDGATIVRAANWHLTDRCNYSCKFCFMQTLIGKEADMELAKSVIAELRQLGITKLNFVGGEPLLHPNLVDFAAQAKGEGLTVSVVTNASLLTVDKLLQLRPFVDWIGVSIDSSRDDLEATLGRGRGYHVANARRACVSIRKAGLNLKVNTVVTKLNFDEDLRPLIAELRPLRWKVFQMLLIEGQNDTLGRELAASTSEFETFRRLNKDIRLESGWYPTFESSDDMVDSYLMLGPDGRVIKNTGHRYEYITLESVAKTGLSEIVDRQAYVSRGGDYDWKIHPSSQSASVS